MYTQVRRVQQDTRSLAARLACVDERPGAIQRSRACGASGQRFDKERLQKRKSVKSGYYSCSIKYMSGSSGSGCGLKWRGKSCGCRSRKSYCSVLKDKWCSCPPPPTTKPPTSAPTTKPPTSAPTQTYTTTAPAPTPSAPQCPKGGQPDCRKLGPQLLLLQVRRQLRRPLRLRRRPAREAQQVLLPRSTAALTAWTSCRAASRCTASAAKTPPPPTGLAT